MDDARYAVRGVVENFKELVPGGSLKKNRVEFEDGSLKYLDLVPVWGKYSFGDLSEIAKVIKAHKKKTNSRLSKMLLKDITSKLANPVVHSSEKRVREKLVAGIFVLSFLSLVLLVSFGSGFMTGFVVNDISVSSVDLKIVFGLIIIALAFLVFNLLEMKR